MISVSADLYLASVLVSHLTNVYLKPRCCRFLVSPVDYFVDPSHIGPVDLLADLLVDLIFLLPLHNMVSPHLKHSMHLWTADWVMCWPLSQRRVAFISSFSISQMQRIFQILLSWNCRNSPFQVTMVVEWICCQLPN